METSNIYVKTSILSSTLHANMQAKKLMLQDKKKFRWPYRKNGEKNTFYLRGIHIFFSWCGA